MSKRKNLTQADLKKIAIYKAENPATTIAAVAKKFKVPYHKARYAIDKYAEDVSLLKGNAKGRTIASKILAENSDEVELMKKQAAFILAQIEVNDKMPVPQRTEILAKVARIKKVIQEFELEAHLKRADAGIIAAIVRRFQPDATNDDIIKIYREELAKLNGRVE